MKLWSLYKESLVTKDEVKYGRFRKTLATCNVTNEQLVINIAEDFLKRVSLQNLLLPGAIDLLDRLKPWYNLHIISNGFIEVQHNKLRLTGLDKYFDRIILSEQVKAQKPSKIIFEHALTSANARKSDSLMIGDNFDADIVGAKNYGIDQVFFEYTVPSTIAFEPTYRITNLQQLINIL